MPVDLLSEGLIFFIFMCILDFILTIYSFLFNCVVLFLSLQYSAGHGWNEIEFNLEKIISIDADIGECDFWKNF